LPEVALRIREEAESEFVSAVSLAKEVGDDPGLAAQLVRIANSPMFRATRSIDDLSQAISRLGVDYSANMVTGLAMQNMFQATTEFVDNRLRDV
jgi:HD-like signal output (HDOD) protein